MHPGLQPNWSFHDFERVFTRSVFVHWTHPRSASAFRRELPPDRDHALRARLCAPFRELESPDAVTLSAAGITVFLAERRTLPEDQKQEFSFFPAQSLAILQREPTLELLVAADRMDADWSQWPPVQVTPGSWLVEGEDLEHLEHAVEVLVPGPPGSFDSGYAGMAGAWVTQGGRIYGFYHSEDHEGMPLLSDGYIPGFWATVALATSDDGGLTWQKHGPVM